jgi:hypothetical protein
MGSLKFIFRYIFLDNPLVEFSFDAWASADFFPGEGKNFPGGARTYFLPKKQRKRYYFSQKKSKNILFLAGLGRPEGGKRPPLPSPADANDLMVGALLDCSPERWLWKLDFAT